MRAPLIPSQSRVVWPALPADSPGNASGAECEGADVAEGCCTGMADARDPRAAGAVLAAPLLKLKAPASEPVHVSCADMQIACMTPYGDGCFANDSPGV